MIKTITIIGGGQMGSRISLACAMNGFTVKVYDKNPEFKKTMPQTIQYFIDYLQETDRITAPQIQNVAHNISYHNDLSSALEGSDLVSESILEDIDAKKAVWSQIDKLADKNTILSTNTSSLMPSSFADVIEKKSNFCAYHFHDLFDAKVVDIMPIEQTSEEVVSKLYDFSSKIDQVPIILKKENPGYVFNAMLIPWLLSACDLVRKQVSTPEEINRCWVVNMSSEKGPIELIDQVGLDLFYHVCSASTDPIALQNAEFIKETYLDKGELGEKSGKGILFGR
jgi:3-hydroxybutyryl-CoA dehydrogenase